MKSLFELYNQHQGKVSDKWSIYLSEYDRLFSIYRNQPVRMLEIGIQNGGSLEIWSKYFPNAQALVGCDINPDCTKLTYTDPSVHVVVGDANTDATEAQILTRSPHFDLIIDDGSHTSGDIVKSFARYFRHLNQGGIFVAEDLHCSYWQNFEGGLYYPYSSISFFKRLADVINHEHWGIEKERKQLLRGFSEQFSTEFDESDLADIYSIEFFNSVCVVHKRKARSNVLGARFIAGQEDVVVGYRVLDKKPLVPVQGENYWTTLDCAPDEDFERLVKAVAERDGQITALYNSNSWRITRPLRIVVHQMKRVRRVAERVRRVAERVRRVAKLVLPAIKRGGGLKNTLKKALGLYRREGLAGVKRGIRMVQIGGEIRPAVGSEIFDRNDYTEWVRRYDTMDDAKRAKLRALYEGLTSEPKISVVMPTYNPRPEWLSEVIESVRGQIYPNWELCIADDASTNPEIRPILERYARENSRIKVVFREENGHISAASNSALELVTGEWVALLDHDDVLPEHALFWVAHSINAHPDVRLIYSDEDKIDESDHRFGPYFKSDWNPDLFYSHNMFSHLGVYEATLLRQVGGFRQGFEGAQDYDLALRCIEQVKASEIFHIPRVLYHWRVHAESTAMSADVKPYAMIAGERAINEHFQRTGVDGSVKLIGYGYEPDYKLPDVLPLVSIIIPTRNGLNLLKQCLGSIFAKTIYANYEILIVDNGSDDPLTLSYLKDSAANPKVRVLRDDSPFNYSRLNNMAVQHANGELVALLNNDIEVISPNWLSIMVSHALRPNIGAVGAKLWYPDGTLQHGGITLGVGGVAAHAHRLMPKGQVGYFARAALTQSFSAVTAACLLIQKSTYLQVGGLNEIELAVGYNDVDFCLRVREAGYRNVWTPLAELYHHESATRGSDETAANKERLVTEAAYMQKRWRALLQNDPAYNPNLTLAGDDFSLAWPPRDPVLLPDLAAPPQAAPVDRVAKTMHFLNKEGLGLEVGPSHNPMAPKREGYNVHILDHCTAEELRVKYTGHHVNLDNIEEVDFVWRGEPLSELIGREHCYDWIVASHVIEHVTDFVGFLRQCEKLLAPGGVISLVVPDKRYCFDYYRWPSNTGDVLQAFTDNCVRHPPGAVFDHFSNSSKMGERITWCAHDSGDIKMVHTLDEAEFYWKLAIKNEGYIDSHRWKFTPSSFRIILNDLQKLGLTELAEVGGFDTEGFEFWIALGKRQSSSVIYDRQALSRSMMREIGESIKCLD